ncbi:PHP domain-containing protein [Labedaea rhizosphaerae]|uniref:Putative hydrolase n=1 Tax=Labedaea rhizosphaerae TaxID=598644 RepID=A0A4R6SEG5_LABRH|nr:PHP domain-containing protein [Labedaea rhizosphaerae]TDP98053.1 putative hydrolase [Labedaea rhizosphaerae]
MDPARALRTVAFHLERHGEPTYRVAAFRKAAAVVDGLEPDEVTKRATEGTLTQLSGIGKATAGVITDAVEGREPGYLEHYLAKSHPRIPDGGAMRDALKGDCHTHSDWSDGGSPIEEMAVAALEEGHQWVALTDHSPRLTVARGLTAERLRKQLDVLDELNAKLAPFRILSGIEVDINLDGTLDQDEELLARLDIVVASVHSKLRMPGKDMTRRMLTAIRNPLVDVLGHCTGRLVVGRGRPESEFDAEQVFAACVEHDVAVEINSRPERLDPPKRLLRLAVETGCKFSIDTDAHAPGQLSWLGYGCERAIECEVPVDRVINTWDADTLTAWSRVT